MRGLAVPLAVLLAALLLAVLLGGCQAPLVRALPEAEANEALAALAAAGVPAEKVAGRAGQFGVQVPRDQVGRAWAVLQAAGLPRAHPASTPDRLVVSPTEARLLEAERRAAHVERVLEALPGVRDARVVVAEAGASAVLRSAEPTAVDRPAAEALLRATLPAGAQISLQIETLPAPPPAHQAPNPPLVGLSAAVVALALACTALLWRLRRLRGTAS